MRNDQLKILHTTLYRQVMASNPLLCYLATLKSKVKCPSPKSKQNKVLHIQHCLSYIQKNHKLKLLAVQHHVFYRSLPAIQLNEIFCLCTHSYSYLISFFMKVQHSNVFITIILLWGGGGGGGEHIHCTCIVALWVLGLSSMYH